MSTKIVPNTAISKANRFNLSFFSRDWIKANSRASTTAFRDDASGGVAESSRVFGCTIED